MLLSWNSFHFDLQSFAVHHSSVCPCVCDYVRGVGPWFWRTKVEVVKQWCTLSGTSDVEGQST